MHLGELAGRVAGIEAPILAAASIGEVLTRMGTNSYSFELNPVFPVGSVYVTEDNTNPATLLGYGTWGLIGSLTL